MSGPDLTASVSKVIDRLTAAPPTGRRVMIAVAGPPGAGKSTLAAALVEALNHREDPALAAALVPMDGFHLDNDRLDALGLRDRKGAPETFDAQGFVELIRAVRADTAAISYPGFDRTADVTVPDAHHLAAETRLVVVEGNYLLLSEPVWADLPELFDVTIFTSPSLDELERRLIDRWLGYGLSREAAEHRARGNDLANARRVLDNRAAADLVLT